MGCRPDKQDGRWVFGRVDVMSREPGDSCLHMVRFSYGRAPLERT